MLTLILQANRLINVAHYSLYLILLNLHNFKTIFIIAKSMLAQYLIYDVLS